jgi:hypothetical protein
MPVRFVSEDGTSVLWQASTNGLLFGTEAEAVAVENEKAYEAKVDAFIVSKGNWNRGQDTRAKALVTVFLAWCDTDAGQDVLAQIEAGTYVAPTPPQAAPAAAPAAAEIPAAPAAPELAQAA